MNIADKFYKHPIRYSFYLFGIISVFWLEACYVFSHIEYFSWFKNLFGHLQDLEASVAPTNSYFTAVAFAGVLVTLFLQKKTISDTTESTQKQSFETILFQLIEIHITNQNEITFAGPQIPRDQKFSEAYKKLELLYQHQNKSISELKQLLDDFKMRRQAALTKEKNIQKTISKSKTERLFTLSSRKLGPSFLHSLLRAKEATEFDSQFNFYRAFFNTHKSTTTRYFRHFYHMLKHIDKNVSSGVISKTDRKHYCNIVKAQLSPHEHAVLFYNCLFFDTVLEKSNYKKLLTKFSMFDDLDPEILFDRSSPVGKIDKKAFGDDYNNFRPYLTEENNV